MDGGGQALVQFGQGRVRLFGDEHDEAVAAVGGHLDGAAGVRLGGERAGFAAALEQAANPGGADSEAVGDLLAGIVARVASAEAANPVPPFSPACENA